MGFFTKIATSAVLVASLAGSASAAVMTLDFTGEPLGPLAGDTYMTSQSGLDFTFTGPGLRFRSLPAAFEAAYGLDVWLSTNGDAGPITMAIAGAVINSVKFLNPINGSVTSEVDIIDAVARDAANVILDSSSSSAEYVTLFGPDIASITFVENSPGQGFVLGQFEIDYTEVPVPASLPLLLAGLGGLAALRRRKKA